MEKVIAVGVMLGAIRIWMGFNVEPESFSWAQAYKDTAHLFMGGLAVAVYRDKLLSQRILFVSLCVLEVVVAVASRV